MTKRFATILNQLSVLKLFRLSNSDLLFCSLPTGSKKLGHTTLIQIMLITIVTNNMFTFEMHPCLEQASSLESTFSPKKLTFLFEIIRGNYGEKKLNGRKGESKDLV